MCGYSSETHVPVWPCWANLNFEAVSVPPPGADLAVVLLELRLVSQVSIWRDGALHEQEDDALGLRRKMTGLAARGPAAAWLAAAMPHLGRATRQGQVAKTSAGGI